MLSYLADIFSYIKSIISNIQGRDDNIEFLQINFYLNKRKNMHVKNKSNRKIMLQYQYWQL